VKRETSFLSVVISVVIWIVSVAVFGLILRILRINWQIFNFGWNLLP
jgi:hypothetical protein